MLAKILTLLMLSHTVYCQSLNDIYLNTHNDLRAEEGAGLSNMVWNATLAQQSASYAAQCNYAHSYMPDVGENLANHAETGTIDVNTIIPSLIRRWVSDEKGFNADGSWSCCSNSDMRCCHYTQVVWSTSLQVGCGYADCGNKIYSDIPNSILLVCQYYPKGNMAGTPPY